MRQNNKPKPQLFRLETSCQPAEQCCLVSIAPATAWCSNSNVMALLQVIAEFVMPVELHVAAVLVAVEERTVVLLEMATTVSSTKVGGVTARPRTEEPAFGEFHHHCFRVLGQELGSRWQEGWS